VPFGSFDVLSDEAVRQGLKDFSQWPTYPQVFSSGKLVGGIDIVQELKDSGELLATLAVAPAAAPAPAPVPAAALAAAEAAALQKPAAARVPPAVEAQARVLQLSQSAPCVLLMKGTPEAPACGFSERAVKLLKDNGVVFKPFDVLEDPGVREAAKEMFEWPTFPMVIVQGLLVGGVDVLQEMVQDVGKGTLAQQLGVEAQEPLEARMQRLTTAAKNVLFMKGSFASPRCGFSAQAVQLLGAAGAPLDRVQPAVQAQKGAPPFSLGDLAEFDIFSDFDVREGLKKRENWPTFPMLFHMGK
jgi:Grx4 family monothiol glutaredoxin